MSSVTKEWVKRAEKARKEMSKRGGKANTRTRKLAGRASERAQDYAGVAVGSAEEYANALDLEDWRKSARETVREQASDIAERVQETAPDVRDKAALYGLTAGKLGRRYLEDAEEWRRDHEDEIERYIGEARDYTTAGVSAAAAGAGYAGAKARAVAGEAGERVSETVEDVTKPIRRALRVRHLVRPIAFVLGAVIIYRRWLRSWTRNWGSNQAERHMNLPGDEIVKNPRDVQTRAISIDASPAEVWPWLVQFGQNRGGLYSYDWLENLAGCDIHSADQILPQYQHLEKGDHVRLVREDYPVDLTFEVAEIEPEKVLVLRSPGTRQEAFADGFPWVSWAFVLREEGGRTRLLVRWRSDYKDTFFSRIWNGWGIEIPHFVMERKTLKGIKQRAEMQV